ncbi:MAG: aspartate-semialdehyde dehydrogenase [Rhodothermaceae bacterium]|nr:aspartate-semialdehyde dehydrogenase [Rhodothermaceae bacterium]
MNVGILGATGAVGQKFVTLLENHPWFNVTHLAASSRSAGKTYKEAANWIAAESMPESIANQIVKETVPGFDCDFVFSGLDSSVAGEAEEAFARAGYPVISNAKNYRMHPQVPLLIPEVNPSHTALIKEQSWGSDGYIVTNPNCSTVGLVCALKPLYDAFGIEAVQVVTMQALSGAGYPGVSSLDITGNVVPFIKGEEDKLVEEPLKLLGAYEAGAIEEASFPVSAQCNRVAVLDGHLECVSIKFGTRVSPDDVKEALRTYESPLAKMGLPSAPAQFIEVFEDERYPQPRRHVGLGNGMTVSVGRIRPCEILDIKCIVLSHNTVRGAAGGAILNAELLVKQGFLQSKTTENLIAAT